MTFEIGQEVTVDPEVCKRYVKGEIVTIAGPYVKIALGFHGRKAIFADVKIADLERWNS